MDRTFAVLPILLALSGSAVAEESPSVVVAFSEPQLESVARRVRAELRSAERDDVILERRVPLGTCTSRPAAEGATAQVGVILQTEGGGIVTAEICANPGPNQVTVVTARGHLNKEGDFAIVVTEALHGLLIAPLAQPQQEPAVEVLPEKPDDSQERARASTAPIPSLSMGARMVLDIPTGGYWAGVAPKIQVPLYGKVSLGAEIFLGIRPIAYSDEVVELESHLAWARFGLSASDRFGPFRLGWGLRGGLFSNRATADAVAPSQGGSDGTFGAIFGAGAFGEFPASGPFYLNGSVGLSTLLPRLNYQMSEEITREVGTLLFEGGLGLGFRLGRPKT